MASHQTPRPYPRIPQAPVPKAQKGVWIDWLKEKGIPGRAYQITTKGQIWSVESEKFLSIDTSKKYLEVDLKWEGTRLKRLVHRLVAQAFIGSPPPDKPEVNHIDGDTHNNTPPNLEYVSRSENITHRNEVLKSDKGGGVSAHHVKCPHCKQWLSISAAKGRND